MFVSRFLKLALATVIFLRQPVFAQSSCTPSVRREWRSLTPSERTEWIDAVKVKHIQFNAILANLTLLRPVSQRVTS